MHETTSIFPSCSDQLRKKQSLVVLLSLNEQSSIRVAYEMA